MITYTDTILKLEFKKEIGVEGRNSTVYIAYDPQLDTDLVIKKISKTDFTKVEEYFTEAQMLYFTQHPNIMPVKYASQDEQNVYIAMEFMEKGSLNSIIEEQFLTPREIIKVSLEFLSGIHFMHAKKLVHFDIKPTNILINNANKAIVTDFGTSKYLNDFGLARPDKLYSLHIPPEKFDFGHFSFFSDIYQAGLTIYRMCNGNKFFKEQLTDLNIKKAEELADAISSNKFPNKKKFLPHIPKELRNIITKSLSINVEDRYQSVLEMMNDLAKLENKLDWGYNEITNTHSIVSFKTDTHLSEVSVLRSDSGQWCTEGYKIRLADGKRTKINKFFIKNLKTKQDAFEAIYKIL
ncbi:serine/threonine protein kinase [Bacillus safensis]|uniref:serine/threonine-protein kinase n=1 Tax=Bacillus TaxID=1386 RepID=UPI0018CDF250|nr:MULTISPECIES: serine/threonine-protein kinase [Bacillus]MBG9826045.1 serine/threonine protein kinase [Bacillus safensis]MBG9835690.1 serine/threonine protein kinase [Bacillus safensis]MBG9861427.1 serine/threonine protein kinase [Bacillus safensis]MBG9900630.1 serine/threonine protein kinase [Bacillus safensis]MCP9283658.1 serine/threonine protein kinase [Bacillus safensis]